MKTLKPRVGSDLHKVTQQIEKTNTRTLWGHRLEQTSPGQAAWPAFGSLFSKKENPEPGQVWETPYRISLQAWGKDTLKLLTNQYLEKNRNA